MDQGNTNLSKTHYTQEILHTYNFWNATPRLTPMQANTRLNKGDYDKNPAPDFHRCYRGIVGSLGYPGKNHMLATKFVLSYLRGTWNQTICYFRASHKNPLVLWGWLDADWTGDTDTQRSHTGYILTMN